MTIAYINGSYQPLQDASISVLDRAFNFGDGVYEVAAFHQGKLVDFQPHIDRLRYSCQELNIPWTLSDKATKIIFKELMRRNRRQSGCIYWQVSRGVVARDHVYPSHLEPTIVGMLLTKMPNFAPDYPKGVQIVTRPDNRWGRCDIKSTALLANILHKQQAKDNEAFEAWLVNKDGCVTEGSATNAWIVYQGTILTHPAGPAILNGVVRQQLIRMAAQQGLKLQERPFTVDEALNAEEAFITSTSSMVIPVRQIDGKLVGKDGQPGPLTLKLRKLYFDHIQTEIASA